MTLQTWILLAVTLSNVLIAADRWVHRLERRDLEQEWRSAGKPSLQSQIDVLKSEWVRFTEDLEKLRLERASTLASELAAMHASLISLHNKASEHGTEMQKTFGRMNERVIVLESKVDAIVELLDRRRR